MFRVVRTAALVLAASTLPLLVATLTAVARRVHWSTSDFAELLVAVASWLLLGCSVWAALMVLATVLETWSAHPSALAAFNRRACPSGLRRFVFVWCGVGLSICVLTPAQASDTAPAPPALGRVTGAAAPQPVATAPVQQVVITVRAGDTLWSLAQRHLDDGTRWPELYRLNHQRRQHDGRRLTHPDLIEPGWQLRLPHNPLERP